MCPKSVPCGAPLVTPACSLLALLLLPIFVVVNYAHEGLGLSLRSAMSVPGVRGLSLQHVTQEKVLKCTRDAPMY